MNTIKSVTLAAILLFLTNCVSEDGQVRLPERSFTVVFEDNFSGDAGSLPNPEYWNFETGRGPNGDGWGNQEQQYYTDSPDNISLDGQGNLVITALNEPFQGAQFTSARINTQGKVEQQFGKIEARMKLPFGLGMWPAFWMLGANFDADASFGSPNAWPNVGEIDIMEYRGQEPSTIHGSLHGPGYSAGNSVTREYQFPNTRFDTDFHVYAIEWGPDFVDYFVDGFRFASFNPETVAEEATIVNEGDGRWVFNDQPFYLILNLAVGGSFAEVFNPAEINADTPFPQKMYVDYVRVSRLN